MIVPPPANVNQERLPRSSPKGKSALAPNAPDLKYFYPDIIDTAFLSGYNTSMNPITYITFAGTRRVAGGDLAAMLSATKEFIDRNPTEPVLIFEEQTGRQVDFDFRGSAGEVVARALPPEAKRGPGRPRLGVVACEVTLLPRHLEWLESQPQGVSAALRRLVDEARRREPDPERERTALDAVARFLTAMAGNFPNYEEALRALYRKEWSRFSEQIRDWPADIRDYLERRLMGVAGETAPA